MSDKSKYNTYTASFIGSIDTSGNASTDWTDIVSTDVKNSMTGTAMSAGLIFTTVSARNTSTTASAFLKLRARDGAGDTTSAELEIPALGAVAFEFKAVQGTPPSTIAYKKAAAGDQIIFQLGLEPATR
tara:strand:+ start:496 stop:882 length:387 start_codon:yes stop_codon:yes gene_type:complete